MKKKISIFVPTTLGMLTAFGPFITDFYLPSLPEMAESFQTSPSMVSMSLTAGMIGLAIGQVLIGPMTDKYGRKHILTGSMLLFAIASVACIVAPNIYIFNIMRVLQGLAGAGGIVISKSMATDMYSGKELARFMAILGAINGIAPVMAPIVGGTVASFASWQGVFCILLAIGIILMVCTMFLKETLVPERRVDSNLANVYANLFRVFRNPLFTLSTTAMSACFFAFFGYIASSPFILQSLYGLSPIMFSFCFGLNALTIGIGAGLAAAIRRQQRALLNGSLIMLSGTCLVAFGVYIHAPLYLLMASYITMMVGFGIMQPATTAIALDSERDNAGAASAMFGAAGFVAGAVSSPLVPLGDIRVTAGAVMVVGALFNLLFTFLLCRKMKKSGIE